MGNSLGMHSSFSTPILAEWDDCTDECISEGHVKVVSTLLQHGASVDIKDKVYLCVICTISASYTYNYHVSIVAATKSYVILTLNSFKIVTISYCIY